MLAPGDICCPLWTAVVPVQVLLNEGPDFSPVWVWSGPKTDYITSNRLCSFDGEQDSILFIKNLLLLLKTLCMVGKIPRKFRSASGAAPFFCEFLFYNE